MAATHDYVFVVGMHRSGTSFVGRWLARHPDATGLVGTGFPEDEGQYVQDVFPTDDELGELIGFDHAAVVKWAYAVPPDGEPRDADPAEVRRSLEASWDPYWEDAEARVRVEKTPSNLIRMLRLQDAFPGARFVVVTRNPVAASLAVRKWGTRPMKAGLDFVGIVDHWFAAMDHARRDLSRVAQVHTVAYESLMRDPVAELARLDAFVGLAPREVPEGIVRDATAPYASYWATMRGGLLARARAKTLPGWDGKHWRYRLVLERLVLLALGPFEARKVLRRFDDRAGEYGYSLDDLYVAEAWVARPEAAPSR